MKIPPKFEGVSYEKDVPKPIKVHIKKLAEKTTDKGIYLWGGIGTGKTHTAYAIKKKWQEVLKDTNIIFWNVPKLFSVVKQDIGKPEIEQKRPMQKMIDTQFPIILDDIGAERPSQFVSEELYLLIDAKYINMEPVIFTSNLSLEELGNVVGDRIASRIAEMCESYEKTGSDKRFSNE